MLWQVLNVSILPCNEMVKSIFRLSLKVRALPPQLSWFSSQKICKEEEEVRKRAGDMAWQVGVREREGRTECLRAGLSRMSVKNESSLSQLFSPIHPLGKFASERTRGLYHVRFPARSARSVVRACGHDALIIYVLSHKFVIIRHTHRVHTITQSESLWLSANCTHQICTSHTQP